MKKAIYLLLLLASLALVEKGWYLARDGLVMSRLLGWVGEPIELGWDESAKGVLKQPFISLGRGRQCYAFLSADGRYVIKIPRCDRFRSSVWLSVLPLHSLREKKRIKKELKQKALIESFKIAFNDLRDSTATIAVRFPGEKAAGETLHIIDRLGRSYQLPLDKTGFVLQHWKVELSDAINTTPSDQILAQLTDVIEERARKGIVCRDEAFLNNYAFDEKRAYQIDVGCFYRPNGMGSEAIYEQSVKASLDPIKKWLKVSNHYQVKI